MLFERFSTECRKIKNKAITVASHTQRTKAVLKENISTSTKHGKTRAIAQVAIDFGFTSELSKKLREFFLNQSQSV